MDSEFTCPECGGHYWGSYQNPDNTRTRTCSGYIGSGADVRRCRFQWHQSDDAKYMSPIGKPPAPSAPKHVFQGHCPDFVDSVIRDPECPACVEMVDADRLRACDARHIARLERLARAQREALDDAEGYVALHRMQALDLQRRLAKHEEARKAEATERSWL